MQLRWPSPRFVSVHEWELVQLVAVATFSSLPCVHVTTCVLACVLAVVVVVVVAVLWVVVVEAAVTDLDVPVEAGSAAAVVAVAHHVAENLVDSQAEEAISTYRERERDDRGPACHSR